MGPLAFLFYTLSRIFEGFRKLLVAWYLPEVAPYYMLFVGAHMLVNVAWFQWLAPAYKRMMAGMCR